MIKNRRKKVSSAMKLCHVQIIQPSGSNKEINELSFKGYDLSRVGQKSQPHHVYPCGL